MTIRRTVVRKTVIRHPVVPATTIIVTKEAAAPRETIVIREEEIL